MKIEISTDYDVHYDFTRNDDLRLEIKPSDLDSAPVAKIANVRVDIDLSIQHRDVPRNPTMSPVISFARLTKQKCLSITVKNFNPPLQPGQPNRLLKWVGEVKEFETVIVTAFVGDIRRGERGTFVAGTGSDRGPYRLTTRARNLGMYEMLKGIVTPLLGPWVWHDAPFQGECYLEFHPRRHWASVSAAQATIPSAQQG